MKSLGEDVWELLRDQSQVSISNRFVGEVLTDVNILGAFSTLNNIVAPLNASIVVLGDRCPCFRGKIHAEQEVSEINHLNSRSRC